MDLSQYKPSKGFVEVFGDKPYKPLPGENYIDMRGRQVSYQQRIRDWDIVTPVELPAADAKLLEDFSFGIGPAKAFTSSQRAGTYVIFPESQILMDPRRVDGRSISQVIIQAQAYYLEHIGSLPIDRLFPGVPGLVYLNDAAVAKEAEAAAEDKEG